MKPRVITLDGPAGVGKSTLAKQVAQSLRMAYLDTGAMFRATSMALGEGSWNWPEERLREALRGLSFALHGSGADSWLTLNGKPLGPEIRTEEVGMWASNLAKLPVVRDFLREAQRSLGREVPLVAEGRDMGTVVFPDAAYKFFLDADPDERARRRHAQLQDMGKPSDLAELAAQIRQRDEQDRTRAVAPLRPAPDAIIIDTTRLTIDQAFQAICAHITADS